MMTREQAQEVLDAIDAVRLAIDIYEVGGKKWSLWVNPMKGYAVEPCRYSSVVSPFGFESTVEAMRFYERFKEIVDKALGKI